MGHQFIIRTDHQSLKCLLDQSLQTPEQQAWLHKFIGFDFKIEYRPGKENLAADALPRMLMLSWSEPQPHFLQDLKSAVAQDPQLSEIVSLCAQLIPPDPNYSLKDGFLYWKSHLMIPPKSPLVQKILLEYHASPIGGHAGVARTIARITSQFYWYKMKEAIKDFVQNCVICQQAKPSTTLPSGLLQPLLIPSQVWEDIAMDFITGLPPSHGFIVIMVVVDRLTKYGHFLALKTDYTSRGVAELFMAHIVKLHGVPKSIVLDRDKVFTSSFWQHLFKL